ncbi:YggT family protein [Leptolyngbya sp. CCY15150]|uniref:YggT family protein n=1 Tax=Leptolyngbya sp. CCY15150 TaxID=2767772 RepID=UPI00194E5373|nr:YggT family protein [Leptolyngbya sp. CCY15150]
MKFNPHDENNLERQNDLQRDKETFRLRQEEKRLTSAQHSSTFIWIVNSIYWLIGMLVTLLIIRFSLRLFGANPDNGFAHLINQLSAPFVAPFSTLFISPTAGGGANIFDVNVLIAIAIYSLLGYLGVSLVRFIFYQKA